MAAWHVLKTLVVVSDWPSCMFSKPLLLCALLCALLLQPFIVSAAYCNGKPKPGAFTNDYPIVDAGLGAPVATVPNGAACFHFSIFWRLGDSGARLHCLDSLA